MLKMFGPYARSVCTHGVLTIIDRSFLSSPKEECVSPEHRLRRRRRGTGRADYNIVHAGRPADEPYDVVFGIPARGNGHFLTV